MEDMEQKNGTVYIPTAEYWTQRLKCQGCELPLVPPVYYCQNMANLHPLCPYCSQCKDPNCNSKIGTSRCSILEKILPVTQFNCEFQCYKGPFAPTEYRVHVKRCSLRPISCSYCAKDIPLRKYLDHLIHVHHVEEKEMLEGTDEFHFNLSQGLPRVQFHKIDDCTLLFRYENSKFWVEVLSCEEEAEVNYRAKVQGLKYDIDTRLQCLSPRNGYDVVTSMKNSDGDNVSRISVSSHGLTDLKRFVNPAIDEELYVCVTRSQCDSMEDDNSISSFESSITGDGYETPTYVQHLMQDLSHLLEEKRSSLSLPKDLDLRKISKMSDMTMDEVDSDVDSVFQIAQLFGTSRTLRRMDSNFSISPELQQKQGTRREHVLEEIISTEQSYVTAMNDVLTGYGEETTMRDPELLELLPDPLQKYSHKLPAPVNDLGIGNLTLDYSQILFGNLSDIHRFHSQIFLPQLQESRSTESVEFIGECFVQHHTTFLDLYSRYCQMMPSFVAVQKKIGENHPWLEACRKRLNHRLPLDTYLMKPVQRITKYQLLLKDLIKCSEGCQGYPSLLDALDRMLAVLRSVDESMLQSNIVDYPFPLHEEGSLRLQAQFYVWTENYRCRPRHLFLYPKSILVCKKEREMFHYRTKINLFEYGLTESPAGENSALRFELWTKGRTKTFLIQAESRAVKQEWVGAINRILMDQLKAAVTSRKQSTLSNASRSLSFSNGLSINVLENV